jgi:hypothetical protein
MLRLPKTAQTLPFLLSAVLTLTLVRRLDLQEDRETAEGIHWA